MYHLLQRVSAEEIDPKDVATHAARARLKLQKARALVAELPDVALSLEQQRAEMKVLEERIGKQRAVLVRVAEEAGMGRIETGGMETEGMGTGGMEGMHAGMLDVLSMDGMDDVHLL